MEYLKLIPAALIGLGLIANIAWQGYRVVKAGGLWRLNALAILATTALLLMPPYTGYASLETAFTRGLLALPFLFMAIIGDPGWFRLLPAFHFATVLLFLTIVFFASP